MKISIVFLTYRPGGYDVLADSLKNQTDQNYELIIVDEMTSRQNEVRQYFEDQGINIGYLGPSKPKCFPELAYNLINAYNTGVIKSTGDIVVIMNDYTWLPPDSIKRWMQFEEKFKQNTCISAGAHMYEDKRPKNLDALISIWDTPWKGSAKENGCAFIFPWIPEFFELAYSAIPYTLLVETNGFPEWADCHAANQLNPFIERVQKVGGKFYVDREHIVDMVNHRDWKPVEKWHQGRREPQGSTTPVVRENCFKLLPHVQIT